MSKTFRPWTIDQPLLLPPSVQDFVGEELAGRSRAFERRRPGRRMTMRQENSTTSARATDGSRAGGRRTELSGDATAGVVATRIPPVSSACHGAGSTSSPSPPSPSPWILDGLEAAPAGSVGAA